MMILMSSIKKYFYIGILIVFSLLLTYIKYLQWRRGQDNKKINDLEDKINQKINELKNSNDVVEVLNGPDEKFETKKDEKKDERDNIEYIGSGDFTI